jgi:hypothetical protein
MEKSDWSEFTTMVQVGMNSSVPRSVPPCLAHTPSFPDLHLWERDYTLGSFVLGKLDGFDVTIEWAGKQAMLKNLMFSLHSQPGAPQDPLSLSQSVTSHCQPGAPQDSHSLSQLVTSHQVPLHYLPTHRPLAQFYPQNHTGKLKRAQNQQQ